MMKSKMISSVLGLSILAGAGSLYAGTTFSVDILETGNNSFTFSTVGTAFDPPLAPLNGGTKILIQGDIYPAGTVDQYCSKAGPFLPDDCVIPSNVPKLGRWYCHATILNQLDGGPFVLGDQMYEFNLSPKNGIKLSNQAGTGANTLMSLGYENGIGDFRPANRSIVGGTGAFVGASGQMKIEFVRSYTVSPTNPIGKPYLKASVDYTQQ